MPETADWTRALDPARCPFCGNDRDLERRGSEWFCPVCSRQWYALSEQDQRFLRVYAITPMA